jgi:hypothetical protein
VVKPGDDGHANRRERNLNDQLDPVNAAGGGNPEGSSNEGAYQGRHDPHHDCEPQRNALPARRDNPAQDTDDQPNDQGGNNPSYLHETKLRPTAARAQYKRSDSVAHSEAA